MFLNQPQNPPLLRSPSMLQRLKSINLYNCFRTEPISSKIATPETTPFDSTNTHDSERHHFSGDANVEDSDEEEEDQDVDQVRPKPASGEVPEKLPRKLKKLTSSKSALSHFKEDDIMENWRRR
ncbi:pathogen-associated molecular patterns-induced protein A70 [Senna tora]|uniref:Pathogen-associated molecular patterns-induced protein A70 n=1 Tax=Senna tora TaxID=362788 RepID=A0A834W7E9_9FABA|nr:pathogen-associated molecular patterns-induced protein A70 [Senna tora]